MTIPPEKRSPPALPEAHVNRPTLLADMDRAQVILVTALAGYGKSMLLAEHWRHASGPGPKVWYTVDRADREDGRLAAALGPVEGGLGAAGAALYLDDAHLLEGAEGACRFLGELLRQTPSLRLIMAGRGAPAIVGLQRISLSREVLTITGEQLAFTEEECKRLGAGESTYALTGGWPAAVALLGRGASGLQALLEYIAGEVLDALPAERLDLLAAAAVLGESRPDAARWMLGCEVSAGEVAWAGREQLAGYDPGRDAWRLHPLIRECVRQRLRRTPERWRALSRRAALWEWERGNGAAALEHALAARDEGLAATYLDVLGFRLLRAGDLAQLGRYLDKAPAAVLESVPDLVLEAAEGFRRALQPRQAVRAFHRAVVGYAGVHRHEGLLRALCGLGRTHADLGEWEEAGTAFGQAEAEMDGAQGPLRAEMLAVMGEWHVFRGRAEAGAALCAEAAARGESEGDRAGAGLARLGLAQALVALERTGEARAALTAARADLQGAALCRAALTEALLLLTEGAFDDAEPLLRNAVAGSPAQQAVRCWLKARLALPRPDAAAALRREDLAAAEALWREGEAAAPVADRPPGLSCVSSITAAWLALARGEWENAREHAFMASRLADELRLPLLRLAARRVLAACDGPFQQEVGAALHVQCLGIFRVQAGGQDLPLEVWGRPQVRALFQFLLVQPGFAASRDALLDLFWPDAPPADARGRLRVALTRLRRALTQVGADLDTAGDLVRIPPDRVGFVDLLAFRSHLAAARSRLPDDPEGALAACKAGRLLYGGDLLPDLSAGWADDLRRRVRQELMELLRLWRGAGARVGSNAEAAAALEEMVALEPEREEEFRELLRLLLQMGRRGDALRRYRRYVTWLKRELGLDPEPETAAVLREGFPRPRSR